MSVDPPQMKLVETATLKKFIGDTDDPDNCIEVIVTENGVPIEHWSKLLVVEGEELHDHWNLNWKRTEREDRDEALRVGDAIHRSKHE